MKILLFQYLYYKPRSHLKAVCYPFFSYFWANSLSRSLCRNAKYLSKLVPAHCWQKLSSVGTSELRGNGPFGAFFRATKNLWRGRILWSKDKLKYMGYFVKECTSLWSSLIKYLYLGFRFSSSDNDNTWKYSQQRQKKSGRGRPTAFFIASVMTAVTRMENKRPAIVNTHKASWEFFQQIG